MDKAEYVFTKLAQQFDPRKMNPPTSINIDTIPSAPKTKGKGGSAVGIGGTVEIPGPMDKITGWAKGVYNGAKRKFEEGTNPEVQGSEYVQARNTGMSTNIPSTRYTMGNTDMFQDSVQAVGKGKYDKIHGTNGTPNAYNDNPSDFATASMAHDRRDSKNEFGINPMKNKYMMQANNGSDAGYGDLNNSKYFNFAREMGKNTDINQAAKSNGADWYNKSGFDAGKASAIMNTVGGLPAKNSLGLQPFKK